MKRREFTIKPIKINKAVVSKVIIDSHYEEKHKDYMSDQLILSLVKCLDGRIEVPEETDDEGYSYFATLLNFKAKQYRLVWLLENKAIYIGVLNAYRDERKD